MSFLRPEFLWALPLVGLPILIHLLNRQRFVRVEFAAMEFLRRAVRRTRRRLFLEDLLLLALRTLAVLALVLALARPGAAPGSLLAGRPARGEVVVLDASLSMGLRSGGVSAWERATEEAAELLAGLDAARGDQAALIRAGIRADRLALGEPPRVGAALAEIEPPDPAAADLTGALAAARATAETLRERGCEQVRISLWSDLQATNWDLEDPTLLGDLAAAAAAGTVRILDCSGDERENLAVTAVAVEPEAIAPGDSALVSARIRSFASAPRRLRIELRVDGAAVAADEVEVAAAAETTWSRPIGGAAVGSRGVEVRLVGAAGGVDGLVADDARAAVLEVRPAPRVVVIGEPAPVDAPAGVADLLFGFLDLGPGAPVEAELVSPNRAAAALDRAEVAVLADTTPIGPELVAALEEHLADGGGLLIAAGPDLDEAGAAAVLAAAGQPELRIGPVEHRRSPSARLEILLPDHPALTLFRDPRWRPLLTEVPHRRFRPLALPPATAGVRVPLRFGRTAGEDPAEDLGAALAVWERGGSRCAVLGAPPLAAWNGMPSVAGGTLPFLLDLVLALAPRAGHDRVVPVGAPLAVELPGTPTELKLIDPLGVSLRPQAAPEPLGGRRVRQPLLDRARAAGLWTVRSRLLEEGGLGRELVQRIAVVPPAAESDPAPLDPVLLAAALPAGVELGPGGAAVPSAPARTEAEDLSGLFFLLVAVLLGAETLLAALLDRRRG
ncbi:MAG: hypothetical protein D6702_02660 [Planctomycetota bacterium]|nr:MAG: hypothetical protein D6702_02660 [Planctomycetota bacterium]